MSDKPKDDDWGMTMPHMRFEKEKNADDFSDDFAPNPYSTGNQPPADDWGVTQQNFNLKDNQPSSSDFDKTTPNINIPRDVWHDESLPSSHRPASDDWGSTAPNINIPREVESDDWTATAPNIHVPPANKPDEWAATAPNINIPPEAQQEDWGMNAPNAGAPKQEKPNDWSMPAPVFRISEGEKIDNLPKRTPNPIQNEANNFDKTTPNFNLSELTAPHPFGAPAPNLNLPAQPIVSEPIAADQAAAIPKTEKASSSKLIYVLLGLIAMLFFGIVALAGVYFLFLNRPPQTAQAIETPKEEPKETIQSSAPIAAAPTTETVLPKEIDYKGAMVLVAAGEFTMGSDADGEESKPAHKITLPAYYIDKTEVTNGEYKKFCDATGKTYPPNPILEKDYFIKRPAAPVVGVSFADAKAYAAWAGKRLPTEAEWEKAASWDETAQSKRAFPWGDAFQKTSVAFGTSQISDVGKFSGGASACGAFDMAGNVLEWVDAFFQPYPGGTSTNAEFGEKNRVVRGGHFGSKSSESLKTTKRIYVSPDIASGEDDEKLVAAIIGFRCAVSADDASVKDVLQAQSK